MRQGPRYVYAGNSLKPATWVTSGTADIALGLHWRVAYFASMQRRGYQLKEPFHFFGHDGEGNVHERKKQ